MTTDLITWIDRPHINVIEQTAPKRASLPQTRREVVLTLPLARQMYEDAGADYSRVSISKLSGVTP